MLYPPPITTNTASHNVNLGEFFETQDNHTSTHSRQQYILHERQAVLRKGAASLSSLSPVVYSSPPTESATALAGPRRPRQAPLATTERRGDPGQPASGDAWGDARHAQNSTAPDGASVPMLEEGGFMETERQVPSKGDTPTDLGLRLGVKLKLKIARWLGCRGGCPRWPC